MALLEKLQEAEHAAEKEGQFAIAQELRAIIQKVWKKAQGDREQRARDRVRAEMRDLGIS